MNPLRVVYVSPVADPPAFVMGQRNAELRRIFGPDAEVHLVSERRRTPEELVQEVQDWAADAVVVSSLAPGHRRAVMRLVDEMLVLHPVREEYRTRRGETGLAGRRLRRDGRARPPAAHGRRFG